MFRKKTMNARHMVLESLVWLMSRPGSVMPFDRSRLVLMCGLQVVMGTNVEKARKPEVPAKIINGQLPRLGLAIGVD